VVKHRNWVSFITTTLLYAVLFGSYFYVMRTYIIDDRQAQDSVVQLSLTDFIPEVIPEVEVVDEEGVEPEP
jgi:protein TonB